MDKPNLLNVPIWSQHDPRWANDRMGSSYVTIGQQGCLVTSTSSLLNYLGIDVNPKSYNHLLSTNYGYALPHNMYWKMPEILWAGQVELAEYETFRYGIGWESTVETILVDDRPALAEVKMDGMQHWVVIIGKINGVFWIYDPWYGDTATLNSRYNNIFRIVSYRVK